MFDDIYLIDMEHLTAMVYSCCILNILHHEQLLYLFALLSVYLFACFFLLSEITVEDLFIPIAEARSIVKYSPERYTLHEEIVI